MEDGRIVELYWARSEEAVGETARKYGAYCHAIAYGILTSAEDAEECVNDTWLRAWHAMPPHRPHRLSVFLGRITRNLSLDLFRRRRREKRGGGEVPLALAELEDCLPGGDPAAQAAELEALTGSLDRFLAALPREKRRIFLLRYWYLVPIRDIAAKTGYSESKVASLLFRLRNQLKLHLEQEGITL